VGLPVSAELARAMQAAVTLVSEWVELMASYLV
jgi:hypothetical protein